MSGGRLTAEVDDRLDLVARGALLYFHLHQGSLSLGHINQRVLTDLLIFHTRPGLLHRRGHGPLESLTGAPNASSQNLTHVEGESERLFDSDCADSFEPKFKSSELP